MQQDVAYNFTYRKPVHANELQLHCRYLETTLLSMSLAA